MSPIAHVTGETAILMDVISIDPITDWRWQRLLDNQENSVFSSPAWLWVLAQTYDFDVRAYVVIDDAGEPVAGLPFCRVADIRGQRIVSLPFSDYCDPLVRDGAVWRSLTEQLFADHLPVTLRCLHNELPLADERLALVKRAKWHGMDLQPSLDTIWRNLPTSVHRTVRRAQQAGVAVRIARDEKELRSFFEMHLRTRKYKYHLLAQPFQFFINIWNHFRSSIGLHAASLLIAMRDDQVIGGTLFLEWNDVLFYKFNASVPNYLSLGTNDFIIWKAIEHAKDRGLRYLDFGLSDWEQEGLIRFKRKFATDEIPISLLGYLPDRMPAHADRPVQDLLAGITDLFTDESVPDNVTERAGNLLYKFFA